MATKIPPHNLREVAAGVQWYLENYERFEAPPAETPAETEDGLPKKTPHEELLDGLIERIPGPDFPTYGQIVGRRGIREAYRTGRGSITMRAVVEHEEVQGRNCLVVKELPFQVNPDNLASKIAELVRDGKLSGIADVRDETSGRTGQRLVIVLKRDAIAKVVLNNLYKHTQLQDTFGVIMLALVDGVPRTLRLDQMIRYWVAHQIEVIQRRTRFRLRKAQERLHIVAALLAAIDAIDEVIALIRGSESAAVAQQGLMALLGLDEIQARAILDMQLRKLAALERQELIDERDELQTRIADLESILASPARQRRDRQHRARRDRLEVRRRPADRDHRLRRRGGRRGPDRRIRHRGYDHPWWVREADQYRSVPGAATRRQGRARGGASVRRHRGPLLCHVNA